MSLEDLVVQVRLGREKDRGAFLFSLVYKFVERLSFTLLAYWHRIGLVGSWHLKATMTSPPRLKRRT